jgi:hypothetical protein
MVTRSILIPLFQAVMPYWFFQPRQSLPRLINTKKWVPWVAYGLAGLVGVERLYEHAHFVSDVFFGAFIGHYMTRTLIKNHRKQNEKGWLGGIDITPFMGFGAQGIHLSYKF